MSVINQVLNQLEQRGAHHVVEQDMVRAVPQAKRNFSKLLLVFGLALLTGIAGWQWLHARKPDNAAGVSPNAAQVLPHPAVAGNIPGSQESGKLTIQHQAAPADAPAQDAISAEKPASRLSFELSPVPLPSTAGHEPEKPHAKVKFAGVLPHATVEPDRKLARKIAGTPPIKTPVAEDTRPTTDDALPMKKISAEQLSDAEYRKASALFQQGRIDDAMTGYRAALRLDAGNVEARQALVVLLLKNKRGKDAERVLQDRLNSNPDQTRFTMMLARLQVERGAVAEAIATLEKALPFANSQADYQAFLAALLQRQNRNDEAIAHYQVALQLAPNNGIWLMGYGISLQALKRNADAKVAFQHALTTRSLSPDLQAFVQQRIKGLPD